MRALPDAVLLIDAVGSVVATNPAADQLFHILRRSQPSSIQELAGLEQENSRLRDALLGRQPVDRVALDAAVRVEIDGEVRKILPRVVPLVAGNERSGMVLVLSDVTELARLDEMRTELVAVASHELRTPVTTLRMSLLMLREAAEKLEPRVRDLIRTALVGVDQLDETVAELLDMTRIEAGRLRLNAESVDLGRLAWEVATWSRPRADELELTLEVDAPGDIPTVWGDRARLRIVMDNIINNALKYTPRGGSIEIRVSSWSEDRAQEAAVRVAVTDTGPGIPSELRSRVFEKFFRVEHFRPGCEESPRGSGIGLYLCKEIVELHGGKIRCEGASQGHGTRIVFDLPFGSHNA